MADSLERLALAMRAQALIHRERGRHNRAKELEAFAFAVETAAALDRATFAPFAVACHELADRCAVILRNDDAQVRAGQFERLREADRVAVSRLRAYAHAVGDEADCAPEVFRESQP